MKPHTVGPKAHWSAYPDPSVGPFCAQVNQHPPSLESSVNLMRVHSIPLIQIISKDTAQVWPQYWPLRSTSSDQTLPGLNSIRHHSLGTAVQPVFYPAKSTYVQWKRERVVGLTHWWFRIYSYLEGIKSKIYESDMSLLHFWVFIWITQGISLSSGVFKSAFLGMITNKIFS